MREPADPGRRIRGTVAVEYALLLPALLLFILGIAECGRLFWAYTTLYRATQAAARCGAVNASICATASQIQNYAVTQAYGLTVDASVFTASTASCGVRVSASFPFTLLIPWVTAGTPSGAFNIITLTSTACYPL
jgi:Flp pilus assembly protein TadG